MTKGFGVGVCVQISSTQSMFAEPNEAAEAARVGINFKKRANTDISQSFLSFDNHC
jgi:hypothetical protein